MNRRGKIRTITFLTAAFFVLAGTAADQYAQRVRWQRATANAYRHAFSEVTASVEQMDNALKKGVYVTSGPMLCSLCDEVYAQSKAAQMALGQLPLSSETLEQTASFVSTLGDYAFALSRSSAQSGTWDRQDWLALSQTSDQLRDRLSALELQLYDGVLTLDSVEVAQARLSAGQQGEGDGDAFRQVEAEFPEAPSLIYDGPFSQHLSGKVPEMTKGAAEITEQEALSAAKAATGWQDLSPAGTVGGTLPCWVFSNADGTRTAQITCQGGYLATALSAAPVGEPTLDREGALRAAAEHLARLGCEDMEESYSQSYDNTLTVNFCYAPEGVRMYPDLVKVSVSLTDGSLTGFEAQGYLTNHRRRTLPDPEISVEEAQRQVSPLLTVVGRRLAVIPSRGEYEVLCWEFTGEDRQGSHVLTYLNALTGAEEKILLLLEDENGTLAV